LLLATNDGLPTLLINLSAIEPQRVQQHSGLPDVVGEPVDVLPVRPAQTDKQRLFKREHKGSGFCGREALRGAGVGDVLQQLAHGGPCRPLDVGQRTMLHRLAQGAQELL